MSELLLGCLTVETLFVFAGIFPRLVYDCVPMLGWAVNRVEFECLLSGVHYVVPGSRRNYHSISPPQLVCIVADLHFPASFFDAEELVMIRMHFFADFISLLDRHQHELKMMSGVQHLPEILVGFG